MRDRTTASYHEIIFTDLDGTLLHPRTYSYQDALPALERVRERNIPLIIVSSKTRPEIERWRERLGNAHPFISENGGGIFIPQGYFSAPPDGEVRDGYIVRMLGMPYAESRRRFLELRERTKISVRGFGDMSSDEVAELTGLKPDEAELARQRDFTEPFIFTSSPDERFLQAIEGAGLRWTQGRLFHVMGDHHKGRAVGILRELFVRQYGQVTTVGIGDSLNDLPFLLAVDRPVLVRREDGSHDERITIPGIIRTRGVGPAGWNEAVLQILSRGES
jgi:mannosyl-3-phosphoglycerate phosphatase